MTRIAMPNRAAARARGGCPTRPISPPWPACRRWARSGCSPCSGPTARRARGVRSTPGRSRRWPSSMGGSAGIPLRPGPPLGQRGRAGRCPAALWARAPRGRCRRPRRSVRRGIRRCSPTTPSRRPSCSCAATRTVLDGPRVAVVGTRNCTRVGPRGGRPSWAAASPRPACGWCRGSRSASTVRRTSGRSAAAHADERCRSAGGGRGRRVRCRLSAPPRRPAPRGRSGPASLRVRGAARHPARGVAVPGPEPDHRRARPQAVVVVESRLAGGSMHTADEALARGITVAGRSRQHPLAGVGRARTHCSPREPPWPAISTMC